MNTANPYTRLARLAIETYVKNGRLIIVPANLPAALTSRQAGVFVSLHLPNGELRGCIGTIFPTRPSIAEEIIANAVAAATQDPRFDPVEKKELTNLEISVDILSKPKTISDSKLINPQKFGLIVTAGDGRSGLLLPDIPGVDTAGQQLSICRRKGGIGPDEPVTLQIFTVHRHG